MTATQPLSPAPRAPHDPADQALSPMKGRGTPWQRPHRFEARSRQAEDDGWEGLAETIGQRQQRVPTRIVPDQPRQILSRNDSPDIGFEVALNPYRGCEHGCIYCYARPTHSYLNLSPGIDFETHILARHDAAALLRRELARPAYVPRAIHVGSATDPYQPAERELRITRQVLEVLADHQHAFSIITKSSGIERDIDLLGPMARQGLAAAEVSLTTLDPALARILEPRAASPARRLQAIERLARAGVPVGVSVSPIIPFINEPELEHILAAAAQAGASRAFSIVLRLPWEVNDLFQHWLQQHFPDRAARVMARIREMRGGRDNEVRFGHRMTGEGPWAELLRQRFHGAARRLGLATQRPPLDEAAFQRPPVPGQGMQASLF